ncbi:MAG: YgjV family protein [Erysipelotrichaceae bacterium]|nr:YgjV family protein [Erysipelotrichaceae bacterium]
MNVILVANILLIIGDIVLLAGARFKEKKQILYIQILSMLIMSLASLLLKGYSGIVQDVLGIIRNLLSIKGITGKYLSYLFIVASIVFGILFNNLGFLGTLPIIANVSQSLIVMDPKAKAWQIKLVSGLGCLCWGVYDYVIKAYAGAAINVFTALSYLYHALKDKKEE